MRIAALILVWLTLATSVAAQTRVTFEADEVAKILTHGPWPLPAKPDPSNRLSGAPEAIKLGRTLFFDDGLSRFGALSCARCHKPDKAWGDGRAKASAAATLDRNTPALYNLRHMRWFGWDGGADSLWMQSIRPLLDPREMAASPEHIQQHVAATPMLRTAYRKLTGAEPSRQPAERVLVTVAKALAAFQETITTGTTPFDRFRDALAGNNQRGIDAYPDAAKRGLRIFVGKGQCSACHSGALFTNGEFHDTGLAYFAAPGRVDSGRHGGLEKLKASPFTLLGRYNDDAKRSTAWKTRGVIAQHRNFGEFRVPSLRNVSLTGPYMHDGSKTTLTDVVRHYSTLDEDRLHVHGEKILRRLDLSETEIADLVAFLETLTASAP